MNEFSQACHHLETLLRQCDKTLDALDCAYAHGYITATTISPEIPDEHAITSHLLEKSTQLSKDNEAILHNAIKEEIKAMDRLLNSEEQGIDITPDDSETLAIWCAGFLEVHFTQADIWLKKHQAQEISELILPIMLISGLFDDEPEFSEMVKDDQLMQDMQEQLPEILIELYLVFRQ